MNELNKKPQDFKIMIVDDEPDLLEMLAFDLSHNGYQVETAGGGNEAFKKFQQTPYHLVITDVRMPQGDGLTLLKNLKDASPRLPVICITGYSEASNSNIMDLGALAVFEKPFDMKKLRSVLAESLGIANAGVSAK